MAPATFIIRPKILPEEMRKRVPLPDKIPDEPRYDESSPSSVCTSQPGSQPMPLLGETLLSGQPKNNTLADEQKEEDASSLLLTNEGATVAMTKTSSLGPEPRRNVGLHHEGEGEVRLGLPGISGEEKSHAGNLKEEEEPVPATTAQMMEESLSSQTGSSFKAKGNLGRLLARKEGTYQPIGAALQQNAYQREDPCRLVSDLSLQHSDQGPLSSQRSSVDLGPVSIGVYPSKDPNTETAVVVIPDHRRRHKPSFDESIVSIESLLPQLQLEDAVGGSSNASLASSSNSAAKISRQSSFLQPPSYIGETPRRTAEGSVGLPSLIQEDAERLRDGLLSLESQRSRNRTAYYSAIGSLEDPTKLGSFVKNTAMKKEDAASREFPSLMSVTASQKSAAKRTTKVQANAVIRRSSFGDSSENANTAATEEMSDIRPKSRHLKTGKTKKAKRKELFVLSSNAFTPRIGNKKEIKYVPAEMRTPVVASSMGTLHRPNYSDALRRVAMIIRQHIVKIESRFEHEASCHTKKSHKISDGLFSKSMEDAFSEEKFVIPRYRCTMVRVPMATTGMVCGMKRIREKYTVPSEAEIYDFASKLFTAVQLSSECSIVSLIYIERLMETARVPLLASTWRPIFMSGLLMASKVWQDLSSWNVEFSSVYPQYALESISALELQFLRMIKWDLYISSSLYAKYYFALRSLDGKHDFRKRYNHMVGGDSVRPQQARNIEERTLHVKEEALQQLSRSM